MKMIMDSEKGFWWESSKHFGKIVLYSENNILKVGSSRFCNYHILER